MNNLWQELESNNNPGVWLHVSFREDREHEALIRGVLLLRLTIENHGFYSLFEPVSENPKVNERMGNFKFSTSKLKVLPGRKTRALLTKPI